MKKYIILIVALFLLLIAFSTLSKIAEPYKELSRLPRCENGVVFTESLRSTLLEKGSSVIEAGTGKTYFTNHYQFINIDSHLNDCTFSVNYEYFYDTLHQQMSITIRAYNESSINVMEVNALIRPIEIAINSTQAESIANEKGVTYDYYHREISIADQTIYYRFYKESLTEGTQVVLELDAQSNEITQIKKPQQFVPLV